MIAPGLNAYLKKSLAKGKAACLTGAGVSAESGIPTFRGKQGLWERYDPGVYATPEGLAGLLRKDPQALADFIVDFYSVILKARPNPAHRALALMENEGRLSAVITQNIDNLHTIAGSRNVIELHGNSYSTRCDSCAGKFMFEKDRLREMVVLLKRNKLSNNGLLRILSRYFPKCACGGRQRTDVVLFGETLPKDALDKAYAALEECETLFVIGTSLEVYPAARLPVYAKQKGAKIIGINNGVTDPSGLYDYYINEKAAVAMPRILEAIS